MYSGSTLTPLSGRVLGFHQKVDRVARHHLGEFLKDNRVFPAAKTILKFEGNNGPDGIKRKSPGKDEPWHFYSPFNDDDSKLIELINLHYRQLVQNLKEGNRERAAFEAAWLSHALVDGLTPAHHYPYEEKINELRGVLIGDVPTTLREKNIITADTRREMMSKNWKVWGPKGLFSTHFLFEWGVATLSAPLSFNDAKPKEDELREILELGLPEVFVRHAREIAVLDLFDLFYRRGWTMKLMIEVRQILVPTITKTVTLAWYLALVDADVIKPPKKLLTKV